MPENVINIFKPSDANLGCPRKFCFNCLFFEGKLFVSKSNLDEMLTICDDTGQLKFEGGVYVYFLEEKMKEVNNICHFYFKSYRIASKTIKIYGYCGHETCKTFQITCNLNDTTVTDDYVFNVYSSSLDFSHADNLTRQVRGTERELIGKLCSEQNTDKNRKCTYCK